MSWLAARWAAAKVMGAGLPWARILPWLAAAAGAVALTWAVYHWGHGDGVAEEAPRAEKRGAVKQDALWREGQAEATRRANARVEAVAAQQSANSTRIEENNRAETAKLRTAYDVLRQQLRDKARGQGVAGGADMPRVPGGATFVDGPPAPCNDALAIAQNALIDRSEEGDGYRQQVLDWQAWYAGAAAAALFNGGAENDQR